MSTKALSLSTAENGVWRHIQGEWRQLFGSFAREGVSIEYHNFRSEKELDWSRSFHADSLEICLNLQGSANLRAGSSGARHPHRRPHRRLLRARPDGESPSWPRARRASTTTFVTVELSREYLARRVGESLSRRWKRRFARFLQARTGCGCVRRRPADEPGVTNHRPGVGGLRRSNVPTHPPVGSGTNRKSWSCFPCCCSPRLGPDAESKKEMFCDRQKRISRERVEQACAMLRRDLENPPSLEMLAEQVGCGTFHLSRMFSQQVGQTVPQYLRQLRLERAAQVAPRGPAQRDRGGDGGRLQQPEPFLEGVLGNVRVLSGPIWQCEVARDSTGGGDEETRDESVATGAAFHQPRKPRAAGGRSMALSNSCATLSSCESCKTLVTR